MGGQSWACNTRRPLLAVLMVLLALTSVQHAAAVPTKWTFLVYMLADNNLEPFGLYDLEEIMATMAAEKPEDCSTTPCGGTCGAGQAELFKTSCTDGSFQRRCCTASNYPDVMVMVDKGQGSMLTYRYYQSSQNMVYADYSLLETTWTSTKTLKALPGGQWQLITEEQETNMASAATISGFLKEGFRQFPPAADRKYMAVFWDHGNGWLGYGADAKCSSTQAYSEAPYCSVASLATLTQGLAAGLSGVTDLNTGQQLKLDIIGFDACLMAMHEIGAVLTPYANYLLASELLEPGIGWDYSALSKYVQGNTWAGAAVISAAGFTAANIADVIIGGYMIPRRGISGLTLALLDLVKLDTQLDVAVNNLAVALKSQLISTPALSVQLLQQRALMGNIEGGENNVDLGSLLTRLRAMFTSGGDLATKVSAAIAAYQAVVVSFAHDGILPDATGMAVYFPPNSYVYSGSYTTFANTDAADLTPWRDFLNQLYTAIGIVGTSADLQALNFLETYAVPYWAVNSNTWITHGTLTTLAGLTADLLYGFISPTGTDFIIAGTTIGRIAQYAAVGAWSGQLWGLVQDLTTGDNAIDGLALSYADEQKLTDSNGNVTTLILQMQVYYAKSCYSPIRDMTQGMLKYTYNIAAGTSTLQLYTSGSSKVWGEVPIASGGVVIPYLSTIDLTGQRTGRASSFGYSDCLKWGKTGDMAIKVASFNARQAAGILGLDLTRDLATMLSVTGLNGRMKALYGAFEPAQKTQGGCQCSQLWSYTNSSGATVYVKGQCVNPDGAQAQPWCQYEPESCTGTPVPGGVSGQPLTDFCAPVRTLSGCKCHANWRLDGKSYYGTCAETKDPRGKWCVVDKSMCGSYRAHPYGSAKTITATIGTNTTTLTGLDFDYCQVKTINECGCSNTWDFGGTPYSGTCRTGLTGTTTVPGISQDTNWCYVDKGCSKGKRVDGFMFDVCTPAGGRVTENGTACQFPATYHGISLYNCISYNHSAPGTETPKPWCFTNVATGAWGYCAPWTCTAALKANCPSGNPTDNPAAWATPGCLATLCNARRDLANVSMCTQDTEDDRTLLTTAYSTLAGNPTFDGLMTGTGSLDAYCNTNFGYQCMDKILDPACPGLFRQNNVWMASTSKASLCDPGCLRQLCQLQEQAKTSVTGTPGVSGAQPSITCADSELTTSVMWSLMRLIDSTCGFPGPASLACNKLLSPTRLCGVDTQLTDLAGNFTDGAALGGKYSASTECTWTVNTPEQPYITMNFSRLSTEPLYDLVTVEDFDGLIGRFSGSDVPSSLTTDTGLMRVQFTADASIQDQGFAANYLATNTPQIDIPVCRDGAKLLQAVLRTRAYASELSWVVAKRSLLNIVFAPTPNEQNIIMAGGLLPPSVKSKVPTSVAVQTDYKDYRSYYSYACLPTGSYNLFTYDSYGDGWEGGKITLTQIVNATTGCELLSGGSPAKFNLTTQFSVSADADTSSSACSTLTSPDGPYFYVEAGLVVMSEDTKTFTLAKQRKLKEGLASILDVDSAQVTIQSVANASADELTKGQNSMTRANKAVAARTAAEAATADGAAGDSPAAVGVGQLPATRRLQGAATVEQGGIAEQDEGFTAIRDMLNQQQEQMLLRGGTGKARLQLLSKLAMSVEEVVASGLLDATQHQLERSEQWLRQQGSSNSAALSATVLDGTTGPSLTANAVPKAGDADGVIAATAAIQEAEAETAAAADVAVAMAAAAADQAGSTAAAAPAGEQLGSGLAESRKLQQLLTLTDEGTWQDVAPAAGDNSTDTTETLSSAPTIADSVPTGSNSSTSGTTGGDASSSSNTSTSVAIDTDSSSTTSSSTTTTTTSGSSSTSGTSQSGDSSNCAACGPSAGSTTVTNSSADVSTSTTSSSTITTTTTSTSNTSPAPGGCMPDGVISTNSNDTDIYTGDGGGDSTPAPLPAVLFEKPLGPSAGSTPGSDPVHSDLMLALQDNTPTQPVKPDLTKRAVRASKGRVAVVEVKFGPWEAFGAGKAARAAAAASGQPGSIAAVPKPGSDAPDDAAATITAAEDTQLPPPSEEPTTAAGAGSTTTVSTEAVSQASPAPPLSNTTDTQGGELSIDPASLPFTPKPSLEPQPGADGEGGYMMFDAIGPYRGLLAASEDSQSPTDSGNSSSNSNPISLVPSSNRGDGSTASRDTGSALAGLLSPAEIDPMLLGDIVSAGREGPRGTGTRPRPPPGTWGEGAKRRLSSSSMATSTTTTSSSSGDHLDGSAAEEGFWVGGDMGREQQQQHGPVTTAHWEGADQLPEEALVLPLSWPQQLLTAEAATDPELRSVQASGRHLLQTAPSKGITIVLRVNGYEDAAAAAAAETDLSNVVTNGTLQTRLAAGGWPGVSLGLLYTKVGTVGTFWSENNLLKIIIAVCVGGGALAAGIFAVWYIRRKRRAGAAQMPGGQGQPGGRPSVAAGPAGRVSYAAGSPLQQQPMYLPPQQAAAMVMPYPGSPYGRTASPSAPAMLSPSQQAALAAGRTPSPQGMVQYGQPNRTPPANSPYSSPNPYGQTGRASVGPVMGSPVVGSPQQQYQQQYLQQQGAYYPVYPAPTAPPQQGAPGIAAAPGSYSFVQAPAGYPAIVPPGGAHQQQQQWQRLG